jgi:signal transduction histidine kinase/CheY-like chemotaxis protein
MSKILVVDDHPVNRNLLVSLLGYAGHEVIEASDGLEALGVARRDRPDLIVSDIIMPTMDGYEFIRQLRSDPAIALTKVILYSASYHDREATALARSCGVSHILRKPAEPEVVLEAVQSALGLSVLPEVDAVPEDFDQEHLRLVTDKLSEQVSKLEEVRSRLATLLEVVHESALIRDTRVLSNRFCDSARAILSAQYSGVVVLDSQGTHIEHSIFRGADPQLAATIAPRSLTPSLRALIKASGIHSEKDPDTVHALGLPAGYPAVHSLLMASLGSHCQGVLYVANKVGAETFSANERDIFSMLAAHFAVCIENARLYSELNQRAELLEAEVQERTRAEAKLEDYTDRLKGLSRRLMEVQENEQRHIARELHDEIGQELTALKIHLKAARAAAGDSVVAEPIGQSLQIAENALQQVRGLTLNLRPSVLDDLGLTPAVRWLLGRYSGSFAYQLVSEPLEMDLPVEIRTVCFRVIQEATTNILRHANAKNVRVCLKERDASLELEIFDDGIGFAVDAARIRARSGSSVGLLGMEERVHLVGGEYRLESTPGSGTRISARFSGYRKEKQ